MKDQEETIQTLRSQVATMTIRMERLGDSNNKYKDFLKGIRYGPPRWAKQYRDKISKFCKIMGL